MATIKLYVRNGEFIEEDSYIVYGDKFSKKEVAANGWTARIEKNGKIVCDSVREYSKGISSMRYTLFPSGYAKLTLASEGGKPKTIKEGYVVRQGEKIEGIIGLSGGNVDNRFAYFRSNEFIDFLSKNRLRGVIRVNPNDTYWLRCYFLTTGKKDENIFTDGEVTELKNEYRDDIPEGSSCYDNRTEVEVQNATWVILRDMTSGWGYLYTLEKNVMNIDFE